MAEGLRIRYFERNPQPFFQHSIPAALLTNFIALGIVESVAKVGHRLKFTD